MLRKSRLTLATTVDVDLGWDGVGNVTRVISVGSHGQGIVELDNTKIELLIHTRDVVDVTVHDDVGGDPQLDIETVVGGTLYKIWPGIVSIIDSTYQMTVKYRQLDFASRFELGRLVFCTDPVEAGTVNGTEFSSRQQFMYRVLLPERERLLFFADPRNAVERRDNSTRIRSKGRRELLEWEWVAESNDKAKRLQVLYEEKPRARLIDWLKQFGIWLFMFVLGAVGIAVKPEAAGWIRDILHLH